MSDYMFMLENHLSAPQNRVVKEVQAAAEQGNVNLFLTGGAVRDMLGGFPIRDLDFTVEGNALKVAKLAAERARATLLKADEERKTADLIFPGGVTVEIGMARKERYSKPGKRSHVSSATIVEDLRGRDFTINSIALSLNRASLGLLLDPNNGLADLEHRELRAVHNHAFFDDPGRILRMVRFRVRFGMVVDDRTQQQYENARLETLERQIPSRRLFKELREIADETSPGDVLAALESEKLLPLFSEALAGPKLNLQGLAKWQKARQAIPFGVEIGANNLALLLYLLTEKLTSKERAAMVRAVSMHKSEIDLWQTLEAKTRKLEKAVGSAKLQKPSHVYRVLSNAAGEEILFLLIRSQVRLVHDRVKNYLQKYLPAAQEVMDAQVAATGVQPGTAKFKKQKEDMIVARLDGRVRKPAPEVPEEQAASVPASAERTPYGTNRSAKVSPGRKPGAAGARR
jgi:tRNA nucleotidyltransferase (CCA-adding enzyme)